MPNNKGYLSLVAIMQKFIDQSYLSEFNYDPTKFEDSRVPNYGDDSRLVDGV